MKKKVEIKLLKSRLSGLQLMVDTLTDDVADLRSVLGKPRFGEAFLEGASPFSEADFG